MFLITGGVASAKEKHYSTEEEALQMAFPNSNFKKETIILDDFLKSEVAKHLGKTIYEESITTYEATLDGSIQGYSYVMNEVGKTKDITFLVSIDTTDNVVAVAILIFRESQGFEVKNKRWLAQFKGKNLMSKLRVKRDIDNISGATMSSRSVTRGVARSISINLALKDRFGTVYFQ